METLNRLQYFLWAALRAPAADTCCPACGDGGTELVRRKGLVTSLRQCPRCSIRFRTPKDDPDNPEKLYADETYRQGFTTDLPSDEALQAMLKSKFVGTEKNFSSRITVIEAAGVRS